VCLFFYRFIANNETARYEKLAVSAGGRIRIGLKSKREFTVNGGKQTKCRWKVEVERSSQQHGVVAQLCRLNAGVAVIKQLLTATAAAAAAASLLPLVSYTVGDRLNCQGNTTK